MLLVQLLGSVVSGAGGRTASGEKDTAFLQVKVKWQDGTVATHATNLNPMEDWEVIWPAGQPRFLEGAVPTQN